MNGYATESYVNTQVSNLVDSYPEVLNTLNELAAALGDDPNFATTVAIQIGQLVHLLLIQLYFIIAILVLDTLLLIEVDYQQLHNLNGPHLEQMATLTLDFAYMFMLLADGNKVLSF